MLKHLPRGSTGVHHPISLRVDARDAARSTRAVAPTNTAGLKRRARALAFLHSHTARRRQAHHRLTCGRLSERRSAAPSTAAQSARSPPLRRPRRSRPCRRSQRRRKRGLSRHDRMSTWPRAPTVWNSEWRYAPNLGFSAPGTSQGPPGPRPTARGPILSKQNLSRFAPGDAPAGRWVHVQGVTETVGESKIEMRARLSAAGVRAVRR